MKNTRPKKRILVISKPAIGDALLITPLIHSIRVAEPAAIIDLMVQHGQESIVEGNRDIDNVVSIDPRPTIVNLLAMARRWWRKYDVAIGNAVDDRMHIYLWLFGRKRVSIVTVNSAAWKRWITFANHFEDERGSHVILRNNALGKLLGYESSYTVYPPRIDDDHEPNSVLEHIKGTGQRYAVLQLDARLPYKRWTDDGWLDVARDLSARGLKLYLTGGGGEAESAYLESVASKHSGDVVILSGLLRFADVSELIADSCIYIGVDTVSSHIAASLGVPSVVLFGPENPYRWGPWPASLETDESPWKSKGSQRLGNVNIVQARSTCDTCESGNCRKRHNRGTDCPLMTGISSKQVCEAISEMLD